MQRAVAAVVAVVLCLLMSPAAGSAAPATTPEPVVDPAPPVGEVTITLTDPTPVVSPEFVVARPSRVRGLRPVRSGGAVTLRWDPVPVVDTYLTRCGRQQKSSTAPTVSLRTAATTCRVRARNAAGVGAWSGRIRMRGPA